MKKYLPLLLFLSCAQTNLPPLNPTPVLQTTQTRVQLKPSYRLEHLCDTQVRQRNLTIRIHNHDTFWDFQPALFSYLKDAFANYQINLIPIYSESPFLGFNAPNEIGIEILRAKQMPSRFLELLPGNEELAQGLETAKGCAITRKGIVLINADWKEIYNYSSDRCEKNTPEWHLAHRINARVVFHEMLHPLGLFHEGDFQPPLIKPQHFPNAMGYSLPHFSPDYPAGVGLTPLQVRLLHSFIAGNNTFQAFQHSGREIDVYEQNIARDNRLRLRE